MAFSLGQLRDANRAAARGWTPEQEEQTFQDLAARYAATALESRTEEDIANFRRWLDMDVKVSGKTGGRALDLGAGEGRSTQRLRELGFDAIGVERSPVVAARAPEGLVIVGDAQDIPVEDASMDLVICNSLVEHVLDPDRVLRELRRVLTPGGVCILHTTNRMHWQTGEINFPIFQWLPARVRAIIWHMSGRTHISPHYFTYSGLTKRAEAVGFRVTSPLTVRGTVQHGGWKGLLVRLAYGTPVGRFALCVRFGVVELHLWAPDGTRR